MIVRQSLSIGVQQASTYPLRFSAREDWAWSLPFRIGKTSGLDFCGGDSLSGLRRSSAWEVWHEGITSLGA